MRSSEFTETLALDCGRSIAFVCVLRMCLVCLVCRSECRCKDCMRTMYALLHSYTAYKCIQMQSKRDTRQSCKCYRIAFACIAFLLVHRKPLSLQYEPPTYGRLTRLGSWKHSTSIPLSHMFQDPKTLSDRNACLITHIDIRSLIVKRHLLQQWTWREEDSLGAR